MMEGLSPECENNVTVTVKLRVYGRTDRVQADVHKVVEREMGLKFANVVHVKAVAKPAPRKRQTEGNK